jgi:transcriptional pleiotropic regulator of transition state genes
MKAIGIVRKVDELGRIVIPMELRRTFGIEREDPLEIFVDDDMIILKKYEPACIFCGSAEEVVKIHNKNVCKACIKEMQATI